MWKFPITSKYSSPLPNFSTPNMVNVSNKLPIVNTLINHTIIQNASVFLLDIFNVSSDSEAFDFVPFFEFILMTFWLINRTKISKNGRTYEICRRICGVYRERPQRSAFIMKMPSQETEYSLDMYGIPTGFLNLVTNR